MPSIRTKPQTKAWDAGWDRMHATTPTTFPQPAAPGSAPGSSEAPSTASPKACDTASHAVETSASERGLTHECELCGRVLLVDHECACSARSNVLGYQGPLHLG